MSGVSPDEARREVEFYADEKPRAGETWYCIPHQWWVDFRRFAQLDDNEHTARFETEENGDDEPALPPLDASSLADENGFELRKDLTENRDFTWVCQEIYDKLVEWFGVKEGTVQFDRHVIEVGMMNEARIEMFPPFVKTCMCGEDGGPDMDDTKIWRFSQQDNLNALLKQRKRDRRGYIDDVRLWRKEESKEEGDDAAKVTDVNDEFDPLGALRAMKEAEALAKKKEAEEDARRQREDEARNGPSAAAATGEDDENADETNSETTDATKTDQEDADEPSDGWVLCSHEELDADFEHWANGIDLITSCRYMLEEKEEFGTWKRKTPAEKWRKEIKLKQKLDTYDRAVKGWYKGIVVEMKGNDIKMHYIGYHSKYDEWVDKLSSEIIAPLGKHTSRVRSTKWTSWSYYKDKEGRPSAPGVVGLENLGNTCFMNSMVQCMCHVPGLAHFFAQGRHVEEINETNPLGWEGKVATAWGDHVQRYWCSKYYVLAPSDLKSEISRVQPRFSGWNQQDSSEFLQFLLDGLHEDLNRVKEKPYTETVESNGRPDAEVAAEAWHTHQLRNDSVIVDSVQGQLKSRVQCPDCDRVSVTFDPYMFLSVPLPSDPDTQVSCVIVPHPKKSTSELSRPTMFRVTAPKIGSIRDLKNSVSEVCNIDASRLVVADIYRTRHHVWNIYKIYMDYEQLAEIRREDRVYVFEVESEADLKVMFGDGVEKFRLASVLHREWRRSTYSNKYNPHFVGVPLVTRVPVGDNIDAKKVRSIIADVIDGYSDMSSFDREAAAEFWGTDKSLDDEEAKNNANRPPFAIAHVREDRMNYFRCNTCTNHWCTGCYLKDIEESDGRQVSSFDDDDLGLGLEEKDDNADNANEENGTNETNEENGEKYARMRITDDEYGCFFLVDWEFTTQNCFDHGAFEMPDEDVSMREEKRDDNDMDDLF